MIALIRMALGSVSPLAWLKAAAAVAMAAWIAWGAYALVNYGRRIEQQQAERLHQKQQNTADKAERRVLDCAGKWNRETSKCER